MDEQEELNEQEQLSLEEAAEILGVDVETLDLASQRYPGLPQRRNLKSGRLVSIPRSSLGLYSRLLGTALVETT